MFSRFFRFFRLLTRFSALNRHSYGDSFPFDKLIWYVLLMGVFYIIGAQFFIYQFPERFKPRVFDIWFNSHTIWHLFVIAGAYTHYIAVRKGYIFRSQVSCMA